MPISISSAGSPNHLAGDVQGTFQGPCGCLISRMSLLNFWLVSHCAAFPSLDCSLRRINTGPPCSPATKVTAGLTALQGWAFRLLLKLSGTSSSGKAPSC